ncbi:ClC family H(+)/Cl(-) exchange transporter [Bifidobacterium sp. ESL0769]|uniref:ClC family H(+)/Cl(-) exchange transporter n=1 Tax=Bifidobacterium sp. ESL0769 TaxID=2983229 RepID=UPI0023F8758A|nr:ClC family H(+)/Cl(-) exchange transporter [Bifidobacterium sp. ESL0769]WEV67366.1 ClC family H(+)/Cl(-) exchange transporter [Bifidobacterium sp. ESL0769]
MATVGISRRSQWIVAARAVICGLIAGVLVTCYRQGIEWGTQFARWMYPQIRSNPWLLAPWALAAVAVGFFVAWLVKLEPMASGSGIPQVEGVVRLGLKMRAGIVLIVRFAGGLLCGMFGLSLGREGPSIQIGAAASQGVAQGMRKLRHKGKSVADSVNSNGSGRVDVKAGMEANEKPSKVSNVNLRMNRAKDTSVNAGTNTSRTTNADDEFASAGSSRQRVDGHEGAGGSKTAETNILITAGAAAGLSSAFNAPLSGMMFALEEVHHNFSPAILLSAAAASISADFVSKYWFGLKPVLDFARLSQLSLPQYWWMIPLGLIAGLIGVAMNKLLLGFQTLYNKLPWQIRPMISLAIALPVGIFLPQVLGGGESLIGFAERATNGIAFLTILLIVKMLFTSTSFGSGVPGGIFMPILAVGTLTGSIFGVALHTVTINGNPLVSTKIIPLFAVCAMAGALTASVKAPMTSILLTVEMSGTLMHMLPVAACSFIALLVSDLTNTEPIYDALLDRYIAGHPEQVSKTAGL